MTIFSSLTERAEAALEAGKTLAFDRLITRAAEVRLFGVRVAQGAVCRENVDRRWREIGASAYSDSRFGSFVSGEGASPDGAAATTALKALRSDLARQPINKELVVPPIPAGHVTWDPTLIAFDEAYAPDVMYGAIARAAARVAKAGYRLTGYVEAQETKATQTTDTGLTLDTRDHGVTIQFTIDDPGRPVGGPAGATIRAAVRADAQTVEARIVEAVDEALAGCSTSDAEAGELEPGRYDLVMHPAAAADFIGMAMAYDMFDRRKVDEGRTFLSGKLNELAFPEGVSLTQSLALSLPEGGVYADLPMNRRLVPSAPLTLIGGGRVKDLHLTPFWAKQVGEPEGFTSDGTPPLALAGAAPGSKLDGGATVKDLIARTERGVYVANFWYLRMVSEMEGVLTGMTRDGIWEIRDGKIRRPLRHMRWHENPFRALGAIDALTQQRLVFGRARLTGGGRMPLAAFPGVRVRDFKFSSVTKF
jgi:predicted Zn-dependent protease